LSLARQRAEQAGMGWVRFEQQDATGLTPGPLFDAVVGRLLLINVPDPGGLLRILVRQVRPGGVIAFQEMDITRCNAVPQTPVMQQLLEWGVTLFQRAGLLPDAGTRLAALFRAAGITPSLIGACRMESMGEGFGYTWIAHTFRSLAPMLHRLEIASPEALDIDTLEARLRQESKEHGSCLVCPLMVGAWGRVAGGDADQRAAGQA
ncbi:MAG TPA: methyltransferase domain-containing protein, partial [Rhodopila sp.]|nr:methyltransferase domain-containing protein [Rhodopila sp.]